MIRVCKKGEFDKLVEILKLSFEKASLDKRIEDTIGKILDISWWERKSLDVKREFNSNPKGTFVKIINNNIAGFITTFIEKESKTGRIMTLDVHPNYQKKGIGTELLNYVLKYFKALKIRLVRIEVMEDNIVALKLYEKTGFKKVANQISLAMRL